MSVKEFTPEQLVILNTIVKSAIEKNQESMNTTNDEIWKEILGAYYSQLVAIDGLIADVLNEKAN